MTDTALMLAESRLLLPAGLDANRLDRTFGTLLGPGIDFGDLYFQHSRRESWSVEDGIVKDGAHSIEQGVGVRAIAGEKTGFAYSDDIQPAALLAAAQSARAISRDGGTCNASALVRGGARALYPALDPVDSLGGRYGYEELFADGRPEAFAREALRQALVNLEAIPAPAGVMPVVLGPGWPGVLLHEAVGHGLEGDFNRKGTSVYAGRIGERVASKGVTIVDDGTLDGRRGSLNIDDEGTPTQCTPLIEDGILVGYMQDTLNARLMGVAPTGNGRRESFAHMTMPRMTNTYMRAGSHDPQEMIRSVKKGLYAVNFGGGQVDITSGKYVFSATEAYLIEDGRITAPVKGATLIGNGPETMQKVRMVGNDLALDEGVGICGKDGQSVPVGVGQPSLLIDGLTVGGTQA